VRWGCSAAQVTELRAPIATTRLGGVLGLFSREPNIKKLEAKGDVRGLLKALRFDDPFIRAWAARALGRLGADEAIPVLIDIARPPKKGGDTDVFVREAAVAGLGHFDNPAARESLERSAKENVGPTSRAALKALNPRIVGQSFHQDRLIALAGGVTMTGAHEFAGQLVPEPSNPHDHHAVAVMIEGQRVAYLSREDAARYFPILRREGPLACQLVVSGKQGAQESWGQSESNGTFFDVQFATLIPAPSADRARR